MQHNQSSLGEQNKTHSKETWAKTPDRQNLV